MKVAVLMGGSSEERPVSLVSGAEVAAALRGRGHEVVAVDPASGVLSRERELELRESGVAREAPPSTGPGGSDPLLLLGEALRACAPDVVFPALHGGAGEDGTVQSLLDLIGVPYAGSGHTGCALAMDKDLTKRLLRDAGIATPEWITGHAPTECVVAELGLPLIVKPPRGGSTLGLTLVHRADGVPAAEEQALAYGGEVMFERYVRGRELTVGILGGEALPPGEIIPENEIFDYECKYQPGMAREIFPAHIPEDTAAGLRRQALAVHRALRLEGFSRVDFILDSGGTPWCLEANALPGLTPASLLPRAGRAAGLSFGELCERIVILALSGRAAPVAAGSRA
ncbi:MAG: D-alanine--D-alanine ligase [Gammaproteobacteria bacterium]|nr:D-alanine--D-alanine ligase [Gammaproteobacteria bacterium]